MFVIVINLRCIVKLHLAGFLMNQFDQDKGSFNGVIGKFVTCFPEKTDARRILCRKKSVELFL